MGEDTVELFVCWDWNGTRCSIRQVIGFVSFQHHPPPPIHHVKGQQYPQEKIRCTNFMASHGLHPASAAYCPPSLAHTHSHALGDQPKSPTGPEYHPTTSQHHQQPLNTSQDARLQAPSPASLSGTPPVGRSPPPSASTWPSCKTRPPPLPPPKSYETSSPPSPAAQLLLHDLSPSASSADRTGSRTPERTKRCVVGIVSADAWEARKGVGSSRSAASCSNGSRGCRRWRMDEVCWLERASRNKVRHMSSSVASHHQQR